jgi:hypothetical protein
LSLSNPNPNGFFVFTEGFPFESCFYFFLPKPNPLKNSSSPKSNPLLSKKSSNTLNASKCSSNPVKWKLAFAN